MSLPVTDTEHVSIPPRLFHEVAEHITGDESWHAKFNRTRGRGHRAGSRLDALAVARAVGSARLILAGTMNKYMMLSNLESVWSLALGYKSDSILPTLLRTDSLAYIVHCCFEGAADDVELDRSVHKRYAQELQVFAYNLYKDDFEEYLRMSDAIFEPLIKLYMQHLVRTLSGPLVKPTPVPPVVASMDAGPSHLATTSRRRHADIQTEEDVDDLAEDDAYSAAGPQVKRRRSGAEPYTIADSATEEPAEQRGEPQASNVDDGLVARNDAIDDATAETALNLGAEVPQTRNIINAFMAISDLAKDGGAKFGAILRDYVLPFAKDRRVIAVTMFCLGVALARTQPTWVQMLQQTFSLARDTLWPQASGGELLALPATTTSSPIFTEAQEQCMLSCLQGTAKQASLDLDQVQHLIGSIKCEGSAAGVFTYLTKYQGHLRNSDYYLGLGRAALCGFFSTTRIVKPLAEAA
ncbi:hypothetical protein EV121DRAFT_267158 [Schizophyllum commune]